MLANYKQPIFAKMALCASRKKGVFDLFLTAENFSWQASRIKQFLDSCYNVFARGRISHSCSTNAKAQFLNVTPIFTRDHGASMAQWSLPYHNFQRSPVRYSSIQKQNFLSSMVTTIKANCINEKRISKKSRNRLCYT